MPDPVKNGNSDNNPAGDPKPTDTPAADQKPADTPATDQALENLAKEFVADLPEELQKVVPASLNNAEKIKFCRDLMAGVKTIKGNNADSPGAERPNRSGGPDLDSMSTNELLHMGLK